MNTAGRFRQLPSVEEVAHRLTAQTASYPRRLVIAEIRTAIAEAREGLRTGETVPDIDARVLAGLTAFAAPSLRHVINATGVVLHTNLGRAPLPAFQTPYGYSNLEYNLETGRRGNRDVHLAALLQRLLGTPAIAVNNNAAAVYLALQELAAGYEAVVSRGQLIEIGDGFRIPDIMQRAGVILREVGTTNRTHIADYRNALTDRTRLLLIVHPSNFSMQGFTAQPSREEIVALARERQIPVYEDLGSGCMIDLTPQGISEPIVRQSLDAGVHLVSFSGDKLPGGPQAGILAGEAGLITRLRHNPMFRALRLDKLIIEAMETTLRHILLEEWDSIPALRMIRIPASEIRSRAEAILAALPKLDVRLSRGQSVIGGGSTPQQSLPTWRIAIISENAAEAERQLRGGDPPVIAIVEKDELLIDLRTVLPEEEDDLLAALRNLCLAEAP